MKKHFLILVFPFIFLLVLFVLTALRHLDDEKTTDETRTVFIKKTENGYQLIRNGKPFYIQGAGGNSYLKVLAEIGGNTIRLYDTLNFALILDDAEKYGLAVIVDIPLPEYYNNYNLYTNKAENVILKKNIRDFINKYKNHPALLIWNLGNELHYPFVFWKNNTIDTFNDLIRIIKNEDPNHPVSTAIAGVSRKKMTSIFLNSPQIDLLSFNSFGGTKDFNSNVDQISFIFGTKPYYFSELGSDGPWEAQYTSWGAQIEQTTTKKAELYNSRYNFIKYNKDKACIGSLIFYWGTKFERTYTWFSLFKSDFKSEIIKEIETLWKNDIRKPQLMGLEYMLVDGKGARDNIIFTPDKLIDSEIKFIEGISNKYTIHWEIYPEGWHQDTTNLGLDTKKPLDTIIKTEGNFASFITPSKEGPYRIFAYVYDKDGYFATTNTPFYVLNTK